VTRKRILRRRYGISEIHAELCAIDLPRAIGDSAGLNKALEAIDALAGPKSQGVGFSGNPGPVSRELDARNSCEHPKLLRGVVRV
jgi:hypothetical protein